MSTVGWSTQGSQLYMSAASPVSYVAIEGVEGIDGPTGTKQEIEITALDDTAARFVSGLPDYGTISFTLYWEPGNSVHQDLLTAYKTTNDQVWFKLTCNDSGAADVFFVGEITGWSWSFAKNDAAKVSVTVKLSGEVSVTP